MTEWIDFKRQRPPANKSALFVVKSRHDKAGDAISTLLHFYPDVLRWPEIEITHWMPLPTPPESPK